MKRNPSSGCLKKCFMSCSVAASSKTQLSTNTERASDAKKAYNSSFESFAAS